MATYEIEVPVKCDFTANHRTIARLKFRSRAKTLPGLMAAAHKRYQWWLKSDPKYMPVCVPDFVPYRVIRVWDHDYGRYVYDREPVCDIFGQFCN